jgi:hypothetical protein
MISIVTIENRLNKIDSLGTKSVWAIMIENWDILVATLLLTIFGTSFWLTSTSQWYTAHSKYTILIAFLVIGTASGSVIAKRLLL